MEKTLELQSLAQISAYFVPTAGEEVWVVMLGNNFLCPAVLCLWLCWELQTSLDRSDHPS